LRFSLASSAFVVAVARSSSKLIPLSSRLIETRTRSNAEQATGVTAVKDLVRRQLAQSVATLSAVLADDAIHDALVKAAQLTAAAMKAGKKLMVCGNGGSAADSQHLVAEFVSRLTIDRPALRAISLTTDTSILTAVGNDYSYDNVFERQVEALGIEGDVLLAISTSGTSKNLLKALKLARKMGIHTIAYTGNKGGAMAELADFNIIIPSDVTMNIQESQLALEHIFCMVVERFYFGADFGSKPQHLAE
jgi:D-sedoheptulose 7-phosphate isomerase